MRQVLSVVDEWRERIEDHPLHHWLADDSDGVPAEQKLWFGAYFINFIMYFRELNHYHISFHQDVVQDAYRQALTGHADEDKTHSRLFMADFRTLDWDSLLGWQPSSVFHWLFSSEVSDGLRRRTSLITKLVVEAMDPLIKFPVVEAIEACGNALFRNTAIAATRVQAKTGKNLIYWGHYHLKKETGHIKGEDAFEDVVLTPEQRKRATHHAVRTFELIDEQNTEMLEHARQTIREGGFAQRSRRFAVPPRQVPAADGRENFDFHFWPSAPHESQREVRTLLEQRVQDIRDSQAVRFFEYTDPTSALARLRTVTLFMATDTTGSETVYKYMVPYAEAATAQERAINRLAGRFGRRSHMIYADWESLGIDQALKWKPSQTLDFIYLDQPTESHRDVRAVVTHYIDAYTQPVLRYWTLVALKMLTAAYGDVFQRLATNLERDLGLSLPYFALRLNPALPKLPPDPEADAIRFDTLALTPEEQKVALQLINDIHAALDGKLRGMAEVVKSGRYFAPLESSGGSAPVSVQGRA